MNEKVDPLEVTVRGGSVEASTVVYGVVQHALSEAGFTEVMVASAQGVKAAHVHKIQAMLDVARVSRPELFATPVSVQQHATLDEVGSLIADNPDQLDIGLIVYGIGDADDGDTGEVAQAATGEVGEPIEAEAG